MGGWDSRQVVNSKVAFIPHLRDIMGKGFYVELRCCIFTTVWSWWYF